MMIELEPSFRNRTGRQNDKSARGHETAPSCFHAVETESTKHGHPKSVLSMVLGR